MRKHWMRWLSNARSLIDLLRESVSNKVARSHSKDGA